MRTLLYVPIIHMEADLGSLAENATKRGISELGKERWDKHKETISLFWDSIIRYFDSVEVSGFRLYQDGMIAEGDTALMLVKEAIKSGSKNYELLMRLLQRGAMLEKTEDLLFVKEERDYLLKLTKARTAAEKLTAYVKYRLAKDHLLTKRDRFIADRINRTLREGDNGILFIGAYHNVMPMLDKDIVVKEIKETKKVRDYQKIFLRGKNNERVETLSGYLISPVRPE